MVAFVIEKLLCFSSNERACSSFGISFDLWCFQIYQQREREAAMLAKKQKTYTLVEGDDDVGDVIGNAPASADSKSQKTDNRKKRFRQKTEHQDDEDDEAQCLFP